VTFILFCSGEPSVASGWERVQQWFAATMSKVKERMYMLEVIGGPALVRKA
jgi:hypothetical protein